MLDIEFTQQINFKKKVKKREIFKAAKEDPEH